MLRTIIMQNFKLDQNRWGSNRPILRPLWLMTSAVADVISVPSVIMAATKKEIIKTNNWEKGSMQ